jgi:hypothetical protein
MPYTVCIGDPPTIHHASAHFGRGSIVIRRAEGLALDLCRA